MYKTSLLVQPKLQTSGWAVLRCCDQAEVNLVPQKQNSVVKISQHGLTVSQGKKHNNFIVCLVCVCVERREGGDLYFTLTSLLDRN